MRFVVTIEETISEDFEVEAASYAEALEFARQKYYHSEFVLSPGNLCGKQMAVTSHTTDTPTEWVEF